MTKFSIGVSGDEGSFSEEACLLYAERAGISPTLSYLIDMEGVLSAVESGEVRLGVFPVANLRGGLVRPAFVAMGLHSFDVVGDMWMEVNQCLITKPGTTADMIQRIVSHPQALAQCRDYLARRFPSAEQIEWADTAKAVRDLATCTMAMSPGCAAIAPARAAKRYGMQVLESGIQDMKPNLTAFLVVRQRGSK